MLLAYCLMANSSWYFCLKPLTNSERKKVLTKSSLLFSKNAPKRNGDEEKCEGN